MRLSENLVASYMQCIYCSLVMDELTVSCAVLFFFAVVVAVSARVSATFGDGGDGGIGECAVLIVVHHLVD